MRWLDDQVCRVSEGWSNVQNNSVTSASDCGAVMHACRVKIMGYRFDNLSGHNITER